MPADTMNSRPSSTPASSIRFFQYQALEVKLGPRAAYVFLIVVYLGFFFLGFVFLYLSFHFLLAQFGTHSAPDAAPQDVLQEGPTLTNCGSRTVTGLCEGRQNGVGRVCEYVMHCVRDEGGREVWVRE
jgi:hypothetical protein